MMEPLFINQIKINMRIIHNIAVLGMATCLSVTAAAQINSSKITTTAVPFLRVSPDARAGGMGDAGIATAPDVNAVFWNRAKFPFATGKAGISATYNPWFKDITGNMYMASVAGYCQLKSQQALSASLRYFNMGDIEQNDYNGTFVKTDQPREFAFDLGYSRKLSEKAGIALALRYINSKLASGSINNMAYKSGSAVAADLSFYHTGLDAKGKGWTWGATLSNLGSRISYTDNDGRKDYIPARLGFGLANTMVFNADNKLTLTGDINKLLVPAVPSDSTAVRNYGSDGVVKSWVKSFDDNSRFQVSLGAEYSFKNEFILRGGYFVETKNEGDRKYFTAGAGINYHSFGLNFSYLVPFNDASNRNPLSNTLRFGLLYTIAK
jgi:hypothetical protein